MKRIAAVLVLLLASAFSMAQSAESSRRPARIVFADGYGQGTSVPIAEHDIEDEPSAAAAVASTTLPVAPPYLDLDESTAWLTCGNCGNSGATGATATYSVTPQSSVSLDGMADKFAVSGNGQPYANGFWYMKRAGDFSAYTHYSYSFFLYVPTSYALIPQAIEFQVQQIINGRVYNGAWQAEWRAKIWRVYNYELKKWEATSIPVALAPGQWHFIEANYHRNPDQTMVHDSLTVDGIVYPVNLIHNSVARYSSTSNDLNNAFQLDTNSVGAAYSVYVDRMQLTGH